MPNIERILQQILNDKQHAAASDKVKEILCLAYAGSGKSRTLAFRDATFIAD